MSGSEKPTARTEEQTLRDEIVRLNKIVQALMDRAERSTSSQVSEFGLFQTTIVLEDLVERRTEELAQALERNEKISRTLAESEARFHGLADQSLAGIAIVGGDRFTYANARFAETFGYTREEVMSLSPIELVVEASRPAMKEHARRCIADDPRETLLTYQCRRKDGSVVDVDLSSSRLYVGGEVALVFVITDVTSRMQAERRVQALNRRLAEQAIRDPLTNLYNRRFMEDSLQRELVRARRQTYPVSVIMCDIDHFKTINDTYGHQTGDKVLKAFGSLVRRRCRGSDFGSRYGGEEFLLVFPNMPGDIACVRAEQLRVATAAMRVPSGNEVLRITSSFGVAVFPLHGLTLDGIISSADEAQYQAKAAGRNQVKCAVDPERLP